MWFEFTLGLTKMTGELKKKDRLADILRPLGANAMRNKEENNKIFCLLNCRCSGLFIWYLYVMTKT